MFHRELRWFFLFVFLSKGYNTHSCIFSFCLKKKKINQHCDHNSKSQFPKNKPANPPKNYLTWKHRQYLHWEKMPDSFAFNLSLQSSLKIKEVSLRQLHFHANGQQKEWPSRKLLSESLSNQPAEQSIKTFKKVNGDGIRNLDYALQGFFGWVFFFLFI